MNKIYYVANFRMPTEKAHGIQVAKMCEALIEAGADIILVVPRRKTDPRSVREFYGLRVEVPLVRLPTLELRRYEWFGYLCMSISFSVSYLAFLWWKFLCGERFILYTVDADRYSSSALALIPAPLFSEMHGAKPRSFAQRLLFTRVRGIIAINRIIVEELKKMFSIFNALYLVEPNGVDSSMFFPLDKAQARRELGLPPEADIVLYAGRFYDWKGLEIIPRTAFLTPEIRWQMVGGTREEFATLVTDNIPPNMYFAGGRPHREMPRWVASADAVLVLGTKRDEQSYRWTSPMKLFEYMACGATTIAAATPAIWEVVSEKETFFYEPDDAESLTKTVNAVFEHPKEAMRRGDAAFKKSKHLSWRGRAERVLCFIETALKT